MKDPLDELGFYQKSLELYDQCWKDTDLMISDVRGRELTRQLIRSVGSISANIEEGYGRGFGKEYPQYLRISRGSARESKGWYKKSKFLLDQKTIAQRVAVLDDIIASLVKTINTLENRKK